MNAGPLSLFPSVWAAREPAGDFEPLAPHRCISRREASEAGVLWREVRAGQPEEARTKGMRAPMTNGPRSARGSFPRGETRARAFSRLIIAPPPSLPHPLFPPPPPLPPARTRASQPRRPKPSSRLPRPHYCPREPSSPHPHAAPAATTAPALLFTTPSKKALLVPRHTTPFSSHTTPWLLRCPTRPRRCSPPPPPPLPLHPPSLRRPITSRSSRSRACAGLCISCTVRPPPPPLFS